MSHCADVYIIPRAAPAARDFDLFPKKKLDSSTCTTTCTAVRACGKEQLDFYVPYPTCTFFFLFFLFYLDFMIANRNILPLGCQVPERRLFGFSLGDDESS